MSTPDDELNELDTTPSPSDEEKIVVRIRGDRQQRQGGGSVEPQALRDRLKNQPQSTGPEQRVGGSACCIVLFAELFAVATGLVVSSPLLHRRPTKW